MKVGSRVRVVADVYKEMTGLVGTILEFGYDSTSAIVQFDIPVWCAVACLEEIDE